jgi:Meckel syndrome type 1 protein
VNADAHGDAVSAIASAKQAATGPSRAATAAIESAAETIDVPQTAPFAGDRLVTDPVPPQPVAPPTTNVGATLVASVVAATTAVVNSALAGPPPQRPPALAAQQATLMAPAAPPADATLATLALASRIQSQIQPQSPTMVANDVLAPLALSLAAVPAVVLPAVASTATPAPAQPKAATRSESSGQSNVASVDQAAEPSSAVEAIHAVQGQADGAGVQPAASRSGGQAGGAEASTAEPVNASDRSPPAAAIAPFNPPTTLIAASSPGNAAPIASQIATQVVKAVEGKSTRFDIALEPAGMGRVDVSVRIDPQGQVSAQFSFDNPHAAAEARAQSTQLQQALEQAGFSIGQGGLSFDVGGQGAGLARQDTAPSPQTGAARQPSALADSSPVAAQAAARGLSSGLDITI